MLQKLNFKPGFNKQATDSGAEGQWVDGDFVRFRYGLPEKIGGWKQLTEAQETLPGVARAQHAFTSFTGEKYVAIGTSQGLFLYYEGAFYDISPLDDQVSGTATFNTVQGSANVTVNLTSHGLEAGRYITFNTMSVIPNGFTSSDTFTEGAFEIRNVTSNSFDITTPTVAVNPGGSSTGSATVQPYEVVGPTFQTAGYGWGTYQWNTGTWGTARTTSNVILDPGNWSLDNFGEVLVATIFNGKTFTWNAGAATPRSFRASTTTTNFNTTNNPTKSRLTLVSDFLIKKI